MRTVRWLAQQQKARKIALFAVFQARCLREDVLPCVDFANAELSAAVQEAAKDNVSLHIEPLRGKDSTPKQRCALVQNRMSNYRLKISSMDAESMNCATKTTTTTTSHYISHLARNRIIAVCNFFNYVGYIVKGLVRGEPKKLYQQIQERRREMAVARLGFDMGL